MVIVDMRGRRINAGVGLGDGSGAGGDKGVGSGYRERVRGAGVGGSGVVGLREGEMKIVSFLFQTSCLIVLKGREGKGRLKRQHTNDFRLSLSRSSKPCKRRISSCYRTHSSTRMSTRRRRAGEERG